MNVDFKIKITWTDEEGTPREKWCKTLEAAINYGIYLKDQEVTEIRISDAPQSVPRKERAR